MMKVKEGKYSFQEEDMIQRLDNGTIFAVNGSGLATIRG